MFGKNTAPRNNGRTLSWRNQYLYQVRDLAKLVADALPETIKFPITGRKTAFELGGSAKNFGSAVIISDGMGYPCQGKLLPKMFPNGLQAEVEVFPCCLIGIASYKLGREVLAIYQINKIIESDTTESFGCAEANLVAYIKSPTQFSGSSKKYWYDNLKSEYRTIENFAHALYTKLYTVNCTTPFYSEWFMSLKNQLAIRKRFFTLTDDWLTSGICNANAVTANLSASFDDLYNTVVAHALDLQKDPKNRIIVAVFGHYFANINSDDNIEFISDYTNVDFTKCTLVTEARFMVAETYNANTEFKLDNVVYTYAHTFSGECVVNEDGKISAGYFLTDPTFVEFASKHPYTYTNNILDRKFYYDILTNLNPSPRVLTDREGNPIFDENGEKQFVTPEPKVHPDTQTNMLLFAGSCRNFFSDLKENFSRKNQTTVVETEPVAPVTNTDRAIDYSSLANLTNK